MYWMVVFVVESVVECGDFGSSSFRGVVAERFESVEEFFCVLCYGYLVKVFVECFLFVFSGLCKNDVA